LRLVALKTALRGVLFSEAASVYLRVELVNGLEPQVRRVGQPADGQQVRVIVTEPGDLGTNVMIISFGIFE
jgi:hypothetical protein